jgi:hypothetical protein
VSIGVGAVAVAMDLLERECAKKPEMLKRRNEEEVALGASRRLGERERERERERIGSVGSGLRANLTRNSRFSFWPNITVNLSKAQH